MLTKLAETLFFRVREKKKRKARGQVSTIMQFYLQKLFFFNPMKEQWRKRGKEKQKKKTKKEKKKERNIESQKRQGIEKTLNAMRGRTCLSASFFAPYCFSLGRRKRIKNGIRSFQCHFFHLNSFFLLLFQNTILYFSVKSAETLLLPYFSLLHPK